MNDPTPATPSPSVPGGTAGTGASKPGPATNPARATTAAGAPSAAAAGAKLDATGPASPPKAAGVSGTVPMPKPDAPVLPAPERARVDPPARKTDGLPILYVLGALVLGAAGWYIYTHPPGGVQGEDLVAKYDGLNSRIAALEERKGPDVAPLQKQVAALEARLSSVEQRPATPGASGTPVPPTPASDPAAVAAKTDAAPTDAATGDLASRVAALDKRLTAAEQGVAQVDGKIGPLDARVAAADTKLGQVGATVDTAIAARLAAAEASTTARVNQIGTQLGAQVDAKVGALTDTARALASAQAGAAALASGQKLGAIAGAPPALARYATVAPPTEFALKQSFGAAADAATRASVPDTGGDRPFLSRLWSRAQQSVSLREGDRVLVGDPVTGTLAKARRALDGNDLAAALAALQGLSGPPRDAMAEWMGQAQGLLDARAALAQMARG